MIDVTPRATSKRSSENIEGTNGVQGNLKRRRMAPPSILGKSVPDYENISRNSIAASYGSRAMVATITNTDGQRQVINWVDAPDDIFFVSSEREKYVSRIFFLNIFNF